MMKNFRKIKEPFLAHSLFRANIVKKEERVHITWSRSSSVLFFKIHKLINVHNGINYTPVFITKSFFYNDNNALLKNPHKFGEFSNTKHLSTRINKENEKKLKL